jgi:predicted N-acyltransferase
MTFLNLPDSAWDEIISDQDSKYFFHKSCWLNFLKEFHKAEVVKYKIADETNDSYFYFVGIIIKKGPLRIMGSPLTGTATEYLGPIANHSDFSQTLFLEAMEEIRKIHSIHYLELSSPKLLSHEAMLDNGYIAIQKGTFIVPLDSDSNELWSRLNGKYRNQVRKAKQNNLIVEFVKHDLNAFIKRHYEQSLKVFKRKNLFPTFSVDRIEKIYKNVSENNIISLEIKFMDKSIATAIFLYDSQKIYFWNGASLPEYNYLCPNDLIHWTAMEFGCKTGIKEYDTSGGGSFKKKFGYPYSIHYSYYKTYIPLLTHFRNLYKKFFYFKNRIKAYFA